MKTSLFWGIPDEKIKLMFPTASFSEKCINITYSVSLRNFPGDCGALIIEGANNVDKTLLKKILLYASLSGFNKIFATVVGYPMWINNAVLAFKGAKFKCSYYGKSNRNPEKEDYVFVKRINNCKHKGY